MDIYLVRHGIAEEPDDAAREGRRDPERRLTHEGVKKTEKVARAFAEQISRIDVIFHSPYRRAVETAQIFAALFPQARVLEATGLTPNDRATKALPLVSTFGVPADQAMMIVGHEPHLSSFASLLLTKKEHPILELKKAGIVGIDCQGAAHDCRLMFLLTPKWL